MAFSYFLYLIFNRRVRLVRLLTMKIEECFLFFWIYVKVVINCKINFFGFKLYNNMFLNRSSLYFFSFGLCLDVESGILVYPRSKNKFFFY